MNNNLEKQFQIIFETNDKKFQEFFLQIQIDHNTIQNEIIDIENNIIKYQNSVINSINTLHYITYLYELKLKKEKLLQEINENKKKLTLEYNQYLIKKDLMNKFFMKKRKEKEQKQNKKEDQAISDIYGKMKDIFNEN